MYHQIKTSTPMKNLILILLVLVSVNVKGQTETITEPFVVSNVQGTYNDSTHVLQYIEGSPEYVGFKYRTSTYNSYDVPKYPTSFVVYNKEYSVGGITDVRSDVDTITIELLDNKKSVGYIKIEQPYEEVEPNTDNYKFTLNVIYDGVELDLKGNLDHKIVVGL